MWVKEAKITRFKKIIFKGSPSIHESELAKYCDDREFIVSPGSSNSYVEIVSQEEAFSLRDILIMSDISFTWSVEDNLHNIVIQKIGVENQNEMSVDFSTGDSLRLALFNCQFINRNGKILYETERVC